MGTRKRGLTVSDSVPPDDTATQTYEVAEDATLERLAMRIYVGAELDLHLVPFIRRDPGDTEEILVEFAGKDYVDGDSDFYEFDVSVPVHTGDVLGVRAENQDTTYAYDYRANFDLDSAGGTSRIISFLQGVLP